jgi:hypothetical protein
MDIVKLLKLINFSGFLSKDFLKNLIVPKMKGLFGLTLLKSSSVNSEINSYPFASDSLNASKNLASAALYI